MMQLALFASVPQPRVSRPERLELYLAVLCLRRRGHKVYRRGRHEHLIVSRRGKRICSDALVMKLAGAKR